MPVDAHQSDVPVVCARCGTPLELAEPRCWACRANRPVEGWPPDPRIGTTVLGRLRLTRRVGYGGTGAIYLAEDPEGGAIAIKLLRADMMRDKAMERRFRLEAVLTKSLNIPQVVQTYDFGQLPDGTSYMTMEYVKGVSLDDVLASQGTVSLDVALEVTRQVLAALAVAHSRGVVHRDLKPGNLILSRDEKGRPLVRILDFGFAKVVADAADGCPATIAHLTKGLSILGTPHYMSPEQCRGLKAIDGRADLYSLGVILYRMVTGVLPFNGETPGDIIQQHIEKAPIPPSARWPDIPLALEGIIMRLLEKDRDRRYPDAAAVLKDLDSAFPSSSPWNLEVLKGAAVPRSELFRRLRAHAVPSQYGPGLGERLPRWFWVAVAAATGAGVAAVVWLVAR